MFVWVFGGETFADILSVSFFFRFISLSKQKGMPLLFPLKIIILFQTFLLTCLK